MRTKPRKGDNPELRKVHGFWNPSCACCHREFGVELNVHHILGGAFGRPDHPANLLTLCRECHELCHAGKLTRAMQLQLHLEAGRAFLQSRMGNRRLEEPVAVPEEFRRRA